LTTIVEAAPAKLNLYLGVEPHVVDGKHQLHSVFTTLELHDILTFEWGGESGSPAPSLALKTPFAPGIGPLDVPAEDNLVVKTTRALLAATSRTLEQPLHITLDKHIPAQAGLGGGSSDAAAVIRALARLWGIDPLAPACLEVAQQMGSDVPFFLHGGCALMGGSGDVFERALPQPSLDLVLVKPAQGVSTVAAYQAFDRHPQPLPPLDPLIAALESGAPERIAAALANNLYPAAQELLPELASVIARLQAHPGVMRALLAGSGSTVFGVCESAAAARAAAAHFSVQGFWAYAGHTVVGG